MITKENRKIPSYWQGRTRWEALCPPHNFQENQKCSKICPGRIYPLCCFPYLEQIFYIMLQTFKLMASEDYL